MPQRLERAHLVHGFAHARVIQTVLQPGVEADLQMRRSDFVHHPQTVDIALVDHRRVVLQSQGDAEIAGEPGRLRQASAAPGPCLDRREILMFGFPHAFREIVAAAALGPQRDSGPAEEYAQHLGAQVGRSVTPGQPRNTRSTLAPRSAVMRINSRVYTNWDSRCSGMGLLKSLLDRKSTRLNSSHLV